MSALPRVTVHEYAPSSLMPTHYHTTRKIPRTQFHIQIIKSQFNVKADTKISPTHLTGTERPHKFSPFTFAQGLPSLPNREEHEHEHDIALKLPHLHQMLQLLRKKQGGSNEEGRERKRGGGPGNVYLVGTGPGDPELVTLKALRVMQTADLVLYDRLVSTDILDMVHSGATLLYVGKAAGYHSRTQVFGRGGEEMDFLQQQGIEVKVVPGITAASGIAAELGIPLTHRGFANSVRFLTGHSKKGGTDPLFVVKHAADPESTLVIYMGLATLPALADKLISCGLNPETPTVAVERGTTSQQRMVFAELQNLPDEVIDAHLVSPTLIIIGKVVALSCYWPTNSSKRKKAKNVGTSEVYEVV